MAVKQLSLRLDLDTGNFSVRMRDAAGELKTLSSTAVKAGENVDKLTTHAKKAEGSLDALNRTAFKLQTTLWNITFVFGGFTAGLVKVNAEAQRSIALLEGLSRKTDQLGRKQDAANDFKYLRDFAKNAPYQLGALTDVFVKLKSAGIDPTAGSMKALVDGVASFGGDSETLKRATVAIQQMAGKGVVSMEELRQQLGEAMPTALKIMAKAAGKSVPEFVAEVSKGQVLWKSIQDKFFAELEKESKGASERLMNTLGGQVNVIRSNLQTLLLAIGGFQNDGTFTKGGFMDTLTQGAKDFNAWLSNPSTIRGATEFGKTLAELLVTVKDFVGFLSAHGHELLLLGEAFVFVQGANMAKSALETVARSLLVVKTAQESVIKQAITQKAAQVSAAMATYKVQEAAALKAKEVVASNQAEMVAIQENIAILREEAAQYEANIALAETQKREAMAAAYQQQKNAAAGMGGLFVGAGGKSSPIAGAAGDAIRAEAALVANRQQLTKVTQEIQAAEEIAAMKTTALAAAEAEATIATASLTLGARAGAAAMSGLSFVLDMLGGPWIAGILAGVAALAFLNKKLQENKRYWQDVDNKLESYNELLANSNKYINGTAKTLDNITDSAAAGTIVVGKFAGEVGVLAQKLWDVAAANKAATVNGLMKAAADARTEAAEADRHTHGLGAAFKTSGELEKERKRVQELRDAAAMLDQQAQKAASTSVDDFLTQGEKNRIKEDNKPVTLPPKHGKVTPDQRAQASIDELKANKEALEDLIDTSDRGSKAAEMVRAKIKAWADLGKKVSPELREQWIKEAQEAAKLGKAYDIVASMLDGLTTAQEGARDAAENMGDSYNKTEAASDRYDRKLDAQLKKIKELDPSLATDTERMKKLNETVDQSKAAYRFTQIADAARALAEEMSKLDNHALDPDLGRWDDFKDKVREISEQIESASKLSPGTMVKTSDGKDVTREDLIDSLNKSRAEYSDHYVRQIEDEARRSVEATREGLMTADDARRAAYEREIKRIESLTDISNMNEEERARYAGRMAQVRADMEAAAKAQYERDTETSAQKMRREWEDLNGNLKELTGQWMQDFVDQIKTGEFNFGNFMLKILTDYLETIAKAKLAAILQPAADGLTKMATNFLSSMISAATGAPSTASFAGANLFDVNTGIQTNVAGLSSMPTPIFHSGGMAGSNAVMRMISPAAFIGAQRFHKGGFPGLANNEVAAILKKGERVLNPSETKAYNGGAGGSAPNVQVNVINESGTPMTAQQQGGRFDGESYIVDVMIDAVSRPGKARNAILGAK